MRLLNALLTLVEVGLTVPTALFAGFWWVLPVHAQAQFGLPERPWTPGLFLVLLAGWLFNHLPSRGVAAVMKQRFFVYKVAALSVCTIGFLFGVLGWTPGVSA